MDFQVEPLENRNPNVEPASAGGVAAEQPGRPTQGLESLGRYNTERTPTKKRLDFAIPAGKGGVSKMKKNKLIAVIVVVALVGIGAFWLLAGGAFSQSKVELMIDGPKEIAAGELATYKVIYNNKNKIQLTGAKLTFFYPDSAVAVKDDDVAETNNLTVDIGTIDPGANGEVEFKAYIVGDIGNIKISRATLVYSAQNISSKFQKDADFSTTISSLSIPLTLVAPPTTQNGQNISYILDYRNESTEDKANLRIKFKYPDGFKFTDATPSPSAGNDTWDVLFLKMGAGERITIDGTMLGGQGGTKVVTATLQHLVTTASGDKYVDYEQTSASTTIASAPLSVNLTLNDSQDYVAHLSDRLNYTAEIKNNSKYDILALNLFTKLSGAMYDFTTVQSTGFFDSRTSTIAWNSSVVPEFSDLKPGQTIKVLFTVQLKSTFGGGFGIKDAFVKASVHLETTSVPAELAQSTLIADSEVVTRISTKPSFEQKLNINDTVLGDGGPLPLKVDKKTVVYVHWALINPANDVTSAKITAVLEPGVVWENKTRSSGTLPKPTYDSRTNTVTWNLGTLPGGIGLAFPKYEGVFAISLIPSTNQIGQAPPLLKSVNFSGTDSFTKEKILLNIRNMTTQDISGSNAEKSVKP